VAAALGDLLWSSFYLALGYWFVDSWEQVALLVSQFGQLGFLVLALVLVIYIAKKLFSKYISKPN